MPPRGIEKSTSLPGTNPPNPFRIWTASRMLPFSSAISLSFRVVETCLDSAFLELRLAARARNQALGPEHHHEDEGESENAELVLRNVDRVVAARDVDAVVDPLPDLAETGEVEPRHERSADDHPPDVAHAADDDHDEHDDRDLEREARREDPVDKRAVENADEAAEDA